MPISRTWESEWNLLFQGATSGSRQTHCLLNSQECQRSTIQLGEQKRSFYVVLPSSAIASDWGLGSPRTG